MDRFTGGCLCGDIRIVASGLPYRVGIQHQRRSGAKTLGKGAQWTAFMVTRFSTGARERRAVDQGILATLCAGIRSTA